MAKKLIQIVYQVTDAGLLKAERALKANEAAAKKADQAVNKFGKEAQNAGNNASKSFLNLGTVWKGLIAIGIINFMSNLAKKTFELGVQQEQLNIAFTTFLGSAEKARKLLADLTKFAIVTPFTPDQVNNAAKALLAFGVAGKDIIPTLKMLGDVSAGTGKDLTEMAIIFGQIRSTGRLMGQDLAQLINAGFNPLQVISQKTGKSVAVLKQEMEKGLITFDMVSDAFRTATSEGGLFFNLMEKQSQSVGGLLSTVSGNIDEILKNVFTATSGPIKEFTDLLVELSEGVLLYSKSLETLQAEAGDRENQRLVENFEAFAKAFKELGDAQIANSKGLDIELARLTERKKQLEASTTELTDAELKEYNLAIDRISQIARERAAVDAFVISKNVEISARNQAAAAAAAEKAASEGKFKFDLGRFVPPEDTGPSFEDLLKVADEATQKQREKAQEDALNLAVKGAAEVFDFTVAENERIAEVNMSQTEREIKEEEEKQRRIMEIKQRAADFGIELLGQFLRAQADYNNDDLDAERERLNKRIEAAGSNERARQGLLKEREEFDKRAEKIRNEREKEAQIKLMIIQNLQNALKALGTPPAPNFPLFGVTLGAGLAQIAIAKTIGFKEGVIGLEGPGTGTSDSIPARLSRGESVITAEATARSRSLLEAIQEKRIDDRVLQRLVVGKEGISVKPFDDSRMVSELRQINGRDEYERGYRTMQRIRKGDSLTQHVHSKYH